MRNTAKVLLIILAAIAWQQVVADTENFDDLPAGDWLNDSGTLLAMPPFWSVDTGGESKGHRRWSIAFQLLTDTDCLPAPHALVPTGPCWPCPPRRSCRQSG